MNYYRIIFTDGRKDDVIAAYNQREANDKALAKYPDKNIDFWIRPMENTGCVH